MKNNIHRKIFFPVVDELLFLIVFFMLVSIFLPVTLLAQKDTVSVPGDAYPGGGNLNRTVDKAISGGSLSSTVFKLDLNSRYLLTGSITVPEGERLTIVAPQTGTSRETAPPQILWIDWQEVSNWPDIPEDYFLIHVNGDLHMKNIWVYFADTAGIQMGTPIVFEGDTTGQSGDVENNGSFENCIFDFMPCPWYTASGVICVQSRHFNGVFRNCYFRNCTDRHYSYYGRAVSFPFDVPGFHTDTILFENCTFANMGYVYQQEKGNYADNVRFNHCTFLNIVMFSLESGWWHKMSVTNSIWVNGYMSGERPFQTDYYGQNGGTVRIDSICTFGFEVPFTEQDRRILFANNSYFTEDWLVRWMANNPTAQTYKNTEWEDLIPVPQPMLSSKTRAFFDSELFPYMNSASLFDSTDPGFITPPTDTTSIKYFLDQKWWAGCDSLWAWNPELSAQYIWPLSENLAYINDTLLTAGMNGFPLGDLYRWFPERYQEWKAQACNEDARINQWLETGQDPGVLSLEDNTAGNPTHFTLNQNYPNPFNSVTVIRYTIGQKSRVSLKVFDILGREVATLSDGMQLPGKYAVAFDGSGLSSGVYFYALQTGESIKTGKVLLVK